jgi:signal peptide peptidase SppA
MKPYQPHLIHSILSEPWAISEKYVLDQAVTIEHIIKGDVLFEKGLPVEPIIKSIPCRAESDEFDDAFSSRSELKSIKVITICGPLTKYDQYCGPAGMKTVGQWIQQADNDSNISGILLVLDSPGGSVAGTEELGNIIRDTKKPIVAFIDDLAASAAYWLASQCDEIIANNTTAMVGSIGVLTSFIDAQPALELLGYKFHTITAPQSIDKVKTWNQLRAGNYEEYKENVLKIFAETFINTVKAGRGNIDEKYFTADIYFAKDVIGPLVDKIGNLDFAVNRVAELSISANSIPLNNKNSKMSKPEYKRLAKASGVAAFESADGSITLQADQATAVESALEAHETTNAQLQQKIKDSSNQQARITELEGQLQTANEKIAELEKEPGAESGTINKQIDGAEGSDDDNFYARFNKLKKQ